MNYSFSKFCTTFGLGLGFLITSPAFAADPILPLEKPVELRTETPERAALRSKIGQLIVIGFDGNDATDKGVRNLGLQIERGEVGGILHLGHNIPRSGEDIRSLIAYFDGHNLAIDQPALLHALDQEGGRIQRLKPWHGVDKVVSAKEMVNVSPKQAFNAYKTLACQLSNLGYNWNLGPVVDLDINKRNPVISRLERAFSANPNTVATYAEQFVEAHHACGMATSLKHFPGHGSSGTDSHKGIADVSDSWSSKEVAPYKDLLASNMADSVMTGHLVNRKVDADFPASLSPKWVQGKLRDELNYQGLVVTDDLDMRAVSDQWSIEETSILAIAAGNDVLLLANGLERLKHLPRLIANALLDEIEKTDARFTAEQIETAYDRVMTFKSSLGLVF